MNNGIIKIGIIGDFDPSRPSLAATNDAISHAANHLSLKVEVEWLPTQSLLEASSLKGLDKYSGLFAAPGSPYRSFEGAFRGIRFARESGKPFMGNWGGYQHTLLEYARNVVGIANAGSTEQDPDTSAPVIIPVACPVEGYLAGTSRLSGMLKVHINADTLTFRVYGKREIREKYNCNYELNPEFRTRFEAAGLRVGGIGEKGEVKIIELPDRSFFLATAFQPQLSSTEEQPHPLFTAYLKACAEAVSWEDNAREDLQNMSVIASKLKPANVT